MANLSEAQGMQHQNTQQNISSTDSSHKEQSQGGSSDLFNDILTSELLNHHGVSYFDAFHLDLPVILYDDKFYFYPSMKSMNQKGIYKEEHHAIIKAETGLPPKLDLSITSLVFYEWIGMLIILIGVIFSARKYKKRETKAPHGIQNVFEYAFFFVRDEIVLPTIPSLKLATQLTPYFIGLFFFILMMNLLGLFPGAHTPTGNIAVTAALAITAYFVINGSAIKEIGLLGWLKELSGGAPMYLLIIMVPIEIVSMFTKPFALTIRLFANMIAGHVIILSLLGLIFLFQILATVPFISLFILFIYFLELLVAVLQAYIFTILTSVFVGLAASPHSEGH